MSYTFEVSDEQYANIVAYTESGEGHRKPFSLLSTGRMYLNAGHEPHASAGRGLQSSSNAEMLADMTRLSPSNRATLGVKLGTNGCVPARCSTVRS